MKKNQPALWHCRVVHHRLRPKRYRFGYRLFLLQLDLDWLAEQLDHLPGFGLNHPGLFSFHESDYLDGSTAPLKPRLLSELQKLGWNLPADTQVTLLTLPRMLGYVFHPVSFYFLADRDGNALGAAVEVGNTFGEHKLYPVPGQTANEVRHTRKVAKDFYVSPFSPLDVEFDFRLNRPRPGEQTLVIDIHEHDPDGPLLLSHLRGEAQPLTGRSLWRAFFSYPLLTLRIITAIHRHALVLWVKGLRVTRKRGEQEKQNGILRHHGPTFGDNHPAASTAALTGSQSDAPAAESGLAQAARPR